MNHHSPFFKLIFILLLQGGGFFHLSAEKLNVAVQAEAAILMNADTGEILYEKNPHQQHYPASITKIVTAYCALKMVDDKWDEPITADQDCIGTVTEEAFRKSNYTLPAYYLIPDGSHIGIKRGETLALKDLMHGLMVASGDDAANVIAKFASGNIPAFVDQMNLFCDSVGCTSTKFYNPHGLHHPKQKTSAYDMALITREALKHPRFREIVSTVSYTRPKTNKQEPTMLVQGNRLLRKGPYYYPKAIGVKTGYYSLAGSTFVAAAQDGDRTLIAVLLKNDDRKQMFLDAIKLFETAFNQPKVQRVLLKKGPQKFAREVEGADGLLKTCLNQDVAIEYYPAEEPKVKCLLSWNQNLTLPIQKGDHVANLQLLKDDGSTFQKVPLYAQEEMQARWFPISSGSNQYLKYLGFIIVFSFLAFFITKLFRN